MPRVRSGGSAHVLTGCRGLPETREAVRAGDGVELDLAGQALPRRAAGLRGMLQTQGRQHLPDALAGGEVLTGRRDVILGSDGVRFLDDVADDDLEGSPCTRGVRGTRGTRGGD